MAHSSCLPDTKMGTCCGERAENKQMTAATTKEDHTWSGKTMEGDDGLNTLECLRGRLLAERHASRVAKEEEESMGNKFVELEKKLREEIKLRETAERKLQLLKKKLKSFNISSPSGQWEHSYSSEKCENSCGSSSSSSTPRHSEAKKTKPHTTNPALSENAVHSHNVSEASALIQTHNSPSTTKECGSQFNDTSSCNSDTVYSFSQILCKNPSTSSEDFKNDESSSNPNPTHASPENICHYPNPDYEDLKNDESRLSSLSSKPSVIENEDDHGDFVDNSLALVPVTLPATSQATSNQKPVNEKVLEALDALRRARERLLCSMGTRPMIKVGPT